MQKTDSLIEHPVFSHRNNDAAEPRRQYPPGLYSILIYDFYTYFFLQHSGKHRCSYHSKQASYCNSQTTHSTLNRAPFPLLLPFQWHEKQFQVPAPLQWDGEF